MTCDVEEGSHTHPGPGDLAGVQRCILPLKIVFRRGNKTKDLREGPVNVCSEVKTDHSVFRCVCSCVRNRRILLPIQGVCSTKRKFITKLSFSLKRSWRFRVVAC